MFDPVLIAADNALKTLTGAGRRHARILQVMRDSALSATPTAGAPAPHASQSCRRSLCSGALSAQALVTRDPRLRAHFEQAAREEQTTSHGRRNGSTNSDPRERAESTVVPGASGSPAGRTRERCREPWLRCRDRATVEEHLASHLDACAGGGHSIEAILRVMKDDEARHAANAELAGAVDLPSPVKWVMRAAAKVMTSTAYYV